MPQTIGQVDFGQERGAIQQQIIVKLEIVEVVCSVLVMEGLHPYLWLK